jgi:hypothetical protein
MRQQKSVWISYKLLSLVYPAPGKGQLHCHLKRGFEVAKKDEPEVKECTQNDFPTQRIGILAQRGVYEFYQHADRLDDTSGLEWAIERLKLSQELPQVRERVTQILKLYYSRPFLKDKEVITCESGINNAPHSFQIKQGNRIFELKAAMDCSYREADKRLHIVDFKTGNTAIDKLDRRQLYIYLLAAKSLHPDKQAVASFYHLDLGEQSDLIEADWETLEAYKIELINAIDRLNKEAKIYRAHPNRFLDIYPPNPAPNICQYCNYHSICEFAILPETV